MRKTFNNDVTPMKKRNPIEHYRSIQMVNGLSHKIVKCVGGFTDNIQICIKNQKTVKSLHTKVKDEIVEMWKSGIVYAVQCEDCILIYFGITGKYLITRINQHRGDVISFHKMRERLNLDIITNINDIRKLADMEKNKKEKKELGKLLKYAVKSGIIQIVITK
jgi:predicted GIY-YIG superfamily endonuclease